MRSDQPNERGGHVNRRDLLKGAAAGGVVLAGGGLLSACGSSSSSSSSSTATSSQAYIKNVATEPNPAHGGNLRVGLTSAGTSETLNPFMLQTPIDGLRASALYDSMARPAPYVRGVPGLVTNWTPNADATVWELTLRSGVTWHDGKPFTPEDLIYTLRTFAAPTSFGNYAVAHVRLNDLKKLGPNLVRVPLNLPIADLQGYFIYPTATYVVQDGAKSFTKPIGTGPFKFESFTPGQRSVMTANRDYWDHPKPYPDQLEVISFGDPTARTNALQAGEIDLCLACPGAFAKENLDSASPKVIVGHPGQSWTFYMRCDKAPFIDVRVRQAIKLIADRPQLIEGALFGFGAPGNDLVAPGALYFDTTLPQRVQDLERARFLLKAAGASDLHVTLNTAEVLPGFTAAAVIFAQQAKAAGVTIKVNQQQPSQYFNPAVLYLKESFAQDSWPAPALNFIYSDIYLSNSPFNEIHWKNRQSDNLFYRAQAETDPTKAQALWNEVQSIQYDQGGELVWTYWRGTDAASPKVRGFGAPGSGWMYGGDDFRVWNWGLA